MNLITSGDVLGQATLVSFLGSLANKANNQISAATLPGLAITTGGSTTVKNTNTFTYTSGGVPRAGKATANYAFTAVTHDIPASATAIQERIYVYLIDGAGAVTIQATGITIGANSAMLPEYPAGNLCPFGYLRLRVAAATAFVAATTALDAAGVTATYTDGYPVPDFLAAK
jgi:hypothetical protein